ncbi:MAG: tryptophan synthase subunit alpha [Mobilicoccus sp.]|nr:tryptophan synthase subunit alpha [Mobilicoccus sp.]
MVSRISEVFARAKAGDRAVLVAYLPVGYPTVEMSIEAMRTVVEAGADIVEVGIPYSDPLMDGPVIQNAATVALARGVRLADTFRAVEAVTKAGGVAAPMTYWNPVLRYGPARFAADLAAAGGAGLITPDLTPDEADTWRAAAAQHDIDPIFLIAPSSTSERLAMTAEACTGFVYVASTMGVTGARAAVGEGARVLIERARALTDRPLAVGLGVSTGAQAAELASYADGVIVGSALVTCLTGAEEADDPAQQSAALDRLGELTRELAAGVRGQA